jgi:hypothetical protein
MNVKVLPPSLFRPAALIAMAVFALTMTWSVSAADGTASAAKPAADGNYLKAGFDVLAGYTFVPAELDPSAPPGTPPPSGAKQIPPLVKDLDGKSVIVTGYMLPTKIDKGLVTEFLLVSSPMLCCYGQNPQVNEFVVVNMGAHGVKAVMDTPVQFYGKLIVKEMYEDGFLTNIYSLAGEKMGKTSVD